MAALCAMRYNDQVGPSFILPTKQLPYSIPNTHDTTYVNRYRFDPCDCRRCTLDLDFGFINKVPPPYDTFATSIVLPIALLLKKKSLYQRVTRGTVIYRQNREPGSFIPLKCRRPLCADTQQLNTYLPFNNPLPLSLNHSDCVETTTKSRNPQPCLVLLLSRAVLPTLRSSRTSIDYC